MKTSHVAYDFDVSGLQAMPGNNRVLNESAVHQHKSSSKQLKIGIGDFTG